MKLIPTGDLVLVVPEKRKQFTKGGIALPDTLKDDKTGESGTTRWRRGEVMSCGAAVKEIKPGDVVWYTPLAARDPNGSSIGEVPTTYALLAEAELVREAK